MGNPDILVCSVGTEIFYETNSNQSPTADKKWGSLLDQGWNRELVVKTADKFDGLKLQVLPVASPFRPMYHFVISGVDHVILMQLLHKSSHLVFPFQRYWTMCVSKGLSKVPLLLVWAFGSKGPLCKYMLCPFSSEIAACHFCREAQSKDLTK